MKNKCWEKERKTEKNIFCSLAYKQKDKIFTGWMIFAQMNLHQKSILNNSREIYIYIHVYIYAFRSLTNRQNIHIIDGGRSQESWQKSKFYIHEQSSNRLFYIYSFKLFVTWLIDRRTIYNRCSAHIWEECVQKQYTSIWIRGWESCISPLK